MKSVYQPIVKVFEVSARNSIYPLREIDESAQKEIPAEVIIRFKKRLLKYGYEKTRRDSDQDEYSFSRVPSWNITVLFSQKKICFCVSNAKCNSPDIMFEICQTASELCDTGELVAWFVNDGRWLES